MLSRVAQKYVAVFMKRSTKRPLPYAQPAELIAMVGPNNASRCDRLDAIPAAPQFRRGRSRCAFGWLA
jgi:hypothetical protein